MYGLNRPHPPPLSNFTQWCSFTQHPSPISEAWPLFVCLFVGKRTGTSLFSQMSLRSTLRAKAKAYLNVLIIFIVNDTKTNNYDATMMTMILMTKLELTPTSAWVPSDVLHGRVLAPNNKAKKECLLTGKIHGCDPALFTITPPTPLPLPVVSVLTGCRVVCSALLGFRSLPRSLGFLLLVWSVPCLLGYWFS